MYIKSLILLSTLLFLSGCTMNVEKSYKLTGTQQNSQVLQQRNEHLAQAVHTYTQDQSRFNVAFNDLNQDGIDDAVVLLTGQEWCGSGGCTMLVFKGQSNQQFEFLSKTTLVDHPIYVMKYLQNGWKQLLVYNPKHGQVMLKFDGKQYPLNPSLLNVENVKYEPNSGQLLFESK